jgi:hypothetical protein
MLPLVGAKETEEVVIRRIVRRMERYLEDLERNLRVSLGTDEFGTNNGTVGTSTQLNEDSFAKGLSSASGGDDDLDAPTARRPVYIPTPAVLQEPVSPTPQKNAVVPPQLPKQVAPHVPPPVPKLAPPPPIKVPTAAIEEAEYSENNSAVEQHVKHEPEFPNAPEISTPMEMPEQSVFLTQVPQAPQIPKAQDQSVSLLFEGRPTPFHKPKKGANGGLWLAIGFAVMLLGLLFFYVFWGPDFKGR